jgi:membrane fusion protein, multidrug efflux system
MKRIGVFLVVALLPTLGITVLACKKDEPVTKGAGGGGRGAKGGGGGAAFAVDVMAVESKAVDYILQSPGTLDAFEHVQVTARVAGVIDIVKFQEGQNVKKGDVLVVIDSERFQLTVNSANAGLAKAQAAQKDTEAMVGRRQGASDQHPGLIPGEELETYKTKSLTAKADTAAAAETVKIAQLNLRDAYVRAPIEGTIQTRTVETGQYVNTGYMMATLLRSDPMLLRFQVEPQEAPRLKPGMTVKFAMRETEEKYEAKISLVAAAADPTTHTVGVTAQVNTDTKKYWLRPGSFCDVTIDVGATRQAPVIPRLATRATDHGYIVYVVQGAVAVEKVVTLGMNTKDGWVEIRSGLAAGDLLVVRGVESMTPNAEVKASKVDSLDASAPEVPLFGGLDGGRREGGGGGGREGGAGRRAAGSAAAP